MSVPKSMSIKEIQEATKQDIESNRVKKAIKSNKWHDELKQFESKRGIDST